MRRADRLFQLVTVLRAGRLSTAAQIAEHLGVSVRTVYRDVDDLRQGGVRIEGEAGVGYRLARDHALAPLVFDALEIEALVLGARLLERTGDRELVLAARRALDKVDAVLPEDLRTRLRETAVYAPIFRSGQVEIEGGVPAQTPILSDLRRALRERQRVRLRYTDGQNTASERTIWPLGLFWWGEVWSLGAWCELREGFRIFRLDRIQNAMALDEPYPERPDRDLAALMAEKRDSHGR